MAPARSSTRRAQIDQNQVSQPPVPEHDSNANINEELFLDPMLGTPLAMYVEKDVQDRDVLVELITKNGGSVSPGYSGVTYILVDPHKPSGQNLYRQYAGKKGKVVLNAQWIHECIKVGHLQTFQSNWAGCKVTGTEAAAPPPELQPVTSTSAPTASPQSGSRRRGRQPMQVDQVSRPIQPSQTHQAHSQPLPPPPMAAAVDPLVHAQHSFPYSVYGALHAPPRAMHPTTAAPPQTWQAPNGIAPQQTHISPPQPHIIHRAPHPYREDPWEGYDHTTQPGEAMGGPAPAGYDYRYRDDQAAWVGGPNDYYDPSYDHSYDQSATYMEEPTSSTAGSSTMPTETAEKPRGRKRNRVQSTPAAPASALVLNRNPPARSPTPPTRVIKSTYGGNLFTSDDVLYLKKYIDYCQEQGLVLSLREICERIAVKAPHHTFYSWRRYCNKHQIRLGGYMMNPDRSMSPTQAAEQDLEEEEDAIRAGPGPGTIAAAQQRIQADDGQPRNRSPTPPRALFRSTTGKGVAFTDEDVTFLVRFMEYRKAQGRLDMVAFWKDVATKAPHHSRASWMKFWRRHKHELNRTETDDPLPQPPDKKMRYSREDDILLAKYFCNKPEGTSDKIFQAFGRTHPHHPWKGWQEHHRIHKAKIDHFIQQLANGETLDSAEPAVVAE